MNARVSATFLVVIRRFQDFRVYLHHVEKMLCQAREGKRQQVHATRILLDPYRDRDIPEYLYDELERVEVVFPRLFRQSLFAQCASDFEAVLVQLSFVVAAVLEEESPATLRENGLRKPQIYLKGINLPFPDDTPEWDECLALADVRNLILHNGSILKNNKSGRIERYRPKWGKSFKVGNNGLVEVNPDLIEHAIEIYLVFLGVLRAEWRTYSRLIGVGLRRCHPT